MKRSVHSIDLIRLTARLVTTAFKLVVFLAVAGAAMAQPCPPGFYSPDGMVDEEVLCPPGYYTPNLGMTAPDAADPGYFVAGPGQSSETICPGGYYASGYATIIPTLCPAGYYAPQGSSAPILSPGGYYAPAGSSSPTLCPAGSYAPSGSSAPMSCPAGYYAPAGSSAPTICPAGSYAPSGSAAPISCPAGYYTSFAGSASPTAASPGYYVPFSGSTGQILCPAGHYASGYGTITPTLCQAGYYAAAGASAPTASPAGDFVPTSGASAPTVDPAGTWSHVASVAARSASSGAPRNIASHIVGPIYFATPPTNTIDLSSGPASLTISNASIDLGTADSLTALTLLSATLSGGNAADFQITGLAAGTVLYEKGVTNINLSVINPSSLAAGTYTTTLIMQTDQSAPFGSPGAAFDYTVTFTVPPPPTLTISLASPGNAVLTWTNAGYNLQSAPEATGVYTTISGATSPYTNTITTGPQFFRLIQQ